MVFNNNSSALKHMTVAVTVRELPRPSGRKLPPPPKIEAPPARQHGKPANKQQSMNPMWMLAAGIGD
jgi:hypothetical protein